jgi:hypothetical protein
MGQSFEFADSPWWPVACTVIGLPLDSGIDRTILKDHWGDRLFKFMMPFLFLISGNYDACPISYFWKIQQVNPL